MKKLLTALLTLALLLALCAPAAASRVVLSPQNLTVNGTPVDCEKYNIDGSNYFKLRDIAWLLRGTEAQFAVSYDSAANAVVIAPGFAYEPVGGELAVGEDRSAAAVPTAQTVWFLDAPVDYLSVWNIGGNNFFKLRDLGALLGFEVDYDAATNTAIIRSPAAAPGDPTRQAMAYDALARWILANYNDTIVYGDEFSAYYETNVFDNGAEQRLGMVCLEEPGYILLTCEYRFPDGVTDVTSVTLRPQGQICDCTYYYYRSETDAEPAFSGYASFSAPELDVRRPIVFDDAWGELAVPEYIDGLAELAMPSFADSILFVEETFLYRFEPGGLWSVADFGFDTDALLSN